MSIQGSVEWMQERCGMITASRIADVLATTKTGEAASRANYRAQLVAERMTKTVQESYTNAAMQWGIDTEPQARIAYELHSGLLVEEVGSVPHPFIKRASASPDGLIDADGLVEIKCPNTATHICYLIDGKPPKKYIPQMAWQCACTGRKWVDFVSFDPRMDKADQLFVVRYTPKSEYLKELEEKVIAFDIEVEALIKQIIERRAK